MKKILLFLIALTTSAAVSAQVTTYDYLFFCDQMIISSNNSVQCLHKLYGDLNEYKNKSRVQFRYFDSYNCIEQPDQKAYDKIKNGTNVFYKGVSNELW